MPQKVARIGPRMVEAVQYVTEHPGCSQQEAALAVGPHGSHAFGVRVVGRAVHAGLITNGPCNCKRPRHTADRYHLYPTESGQRLLREGVQ